jgi:ribosomal protein S18 acetylase RimI-like enzyme
LVEIRLLELEDCLAVAEAHINYLNTPFKGNPGIKLLNIYYEVIARQKGGIGFVGISDDNFAGFACGIWNRGIIKKALIQKWGGLAIYGLRQSLQIPQLIPSFLRRTINPYATDVFKIDGYELRPIVVLPEYRGQGIAGDLIVHVLEDAKQRRSGHISLVVDPNNSGAEELYTKIGFTLAPQKSKAGNIIMRYYF